MEPLLDPANDRLTVYPIKFNDLWNMYKIMQAANWTAEEIDFSQDYDDYQKMTKDEKHFIKMVLAFFAASDMIVNMNLEENFVALKFRKNLGRIFIRRICRKCNSEFVFFNCGIY